MAENEKSKSIFGRAIDAISSRDEKAALEEALNELEEAKKAAAAAEAEAARAKAEATRSDQAQSAAEQAITEAEKRAAEAEARSKALEEQIEKARQAEEREKAMAQQKQMDALRAAKSEPKIITEHTLTSEETLSHLSLKYYGHATKPYWMVIYEANKDVIGDNPNRVHKGLVVKIPELPDELKE